MHPTPGEKYRHYKGHEYEIVGIARHSDSLEEHVVYRGLYDSDEFGPNPLWVRPLSSFIETVTIDGKEQPRFAHIGTIKLT